MSVTILNPYSNTALPWLKGNLHTHTGNSDGPRTPQITVDEYAARGYDFLMLSDHDCLTDPASLHTRSLTLIPGNEITNNGPHLLHAGARSVIPPYADRQQVLDAIAAEGGLAILCHPNWEANFNHCPQSQLEALQGYAGFEIFNGVVTWLEGNPLATDRWDQLLAQGRRLWGFANDDCHKYSDIGVAWNVVQSAHRDVANILDALRAGRFYASTGVIIESIRMNGNTIGIKTKNARRISVFSDFGRRPAMADAGELVFTVPDDTTMTYVRFECYGCAEERAWTQPFFIEQI